MTDFSNPWIAIFICVAVLVLMSAVLGVELAEPGRRLLRRIRRAGPRTGASS
jgi:hypothetical protein